MFRNLSVLSIIGAVIGTACSSDNPVWPKSLQSDTPLFRFVIGVDRNARAGYIDENGAVAIPPVFQAWGNDGSDDFFAGIALVRIDEQDWYINSQGTKLFRSRNSGAFSEGLAPFSENGKNGYLNTQGEIAIPATFESAHPFSEGLAAVQTAGKNGYIDKSGVFVIRPDFALALPFSKGFARVVKQSGCLYVGYGPCDWFNPLVLPRIPHRQPTMKEPRCAYSFIDKTGLDISPQVFRDAKNFAEGLAPVGDGKRWGYLDVSGKLAIPLQYQNAEPFSDGIAAVELNGKWGYVNHAGKLTIPVQFEAAFPFSENVGLVINAARGYAFIKRDGTSAIAGSFTGACSFVMGRAHVRRGVNYDTARWAYIDHAGREVFSYSEFSNVAAAYLR